MLGRNVARAGTIAMTVDVFESRAQAGRSLAAELAGRAWERPVVLALPRGGVPVGLEVARRLDCPLDLVLVRKVGAPYQPEFAVAAVVDGDPPRLVRNPALGAWEGREWEQHLQDSYRRACDEIRRRRESYLAGRTPVPVEGRTAILVDDGLATGTTMRAAVEAMRQRGAARVVVAVPVAPPDAAATLGQVADEVVCLETPAAFGAVGSFYADFHQLDDAEVVRLMRDAPRAGPTNGRPT
jgi:putative phosphoribosyl transferase